ncbi:MAG: hypothetical protein NZ805_03765 [Armatimonadetes bacterium]|nr:hypothetical protein [Armatimonadota bacterium]
MNQHDPCKLAPLVTYNMSTTDEPIGATGHETPNSWTVPRQYKVPKNCQGWH